MDLKEFRRRHREAKRECIQMTTPLILESLPALHMCFITLAPEERTGPLEDGATHAEYWEMFRKVGQTGAHAEEGMVDWLWRDDFAPSSIIISIYGTTARNTTFEFLVAGIRKRDRYPHDTPLSPWIPAGPRTPPDWQSLAASGRFSINWHRRLGNNPV